MGLESQRVIQFWPPTWGQVERFTRFSCTTYKFDRQARDAVTGIERNFEKAAHLKHVAHDLLPALQQDDQELQQKGYTSAKGGRRLTAVIESAVTALYSTVDCTRKVLKAVYPKFNGLPDSTRATFQNAVAGKLDVRIPETIRNAFANAQWFDEFRALRDALTHSTPGSCHLDRKTQKVSYMHGSLGAFFKNGVIEDFFAYIDQLFQKVNEFLGQIFNCLNGTLKDDEVWQLCGFFNGRAYSRFVRPSEAVDFSSGRCDALTWFEKDGNPRCPFADTCPPYRRAKELIKT